MNVPVRTLKPKVSAELEAFLCFLHVIKFPSCSWTSQSLSSTKISPPAVIFPLLTGASRRTFWDKMALRRCPVAGAGVFENVWQAATVASATQSPDRQTSILKWRQEAVLQSNTVNSHYGGIFSVSKPWKLLWFLHKFWMRILWGSTVTSIEKNQKINLKSNSIVIILRYKKSPHSGTTFHLK